jgi:hypothetical protein
MAMQGKIRGIGTFGEVNVALGLFYVHLLIPLLVVISMVGSGNVVHRESVAQ